MALRIVFRCNKEEVKKRRSTLVISCRLKKEVAYINTESVAKIEVEHGEKLAILFDGQEQHKQILERIEKEVTRHEEIILRNVF